MHTLEKLQKAQKNLKLFHAFRKLFPELDCWTMPIEYANNKFYRIFQDRNDGFYYFIFWNRRKFFFKDVSFSKYSNETLDAVVKESAHFDYRLREGIGQTINEFISDKGFKFIGQTDMTTRIYLKFDWKDVVGTALKIPFVILCMVGLILQYASECIHNFCHYACEKIDKLF